MPSYIQIADDPTKWLVAQGISASQLTGQPLSIMVSTPLAGTLVLSGKFASVAIFPAPPNAQPQLLSVPFPAIYVPTASGASQGHNGYQLPASADLTQLANQIAASMSNGHIQAVTLGGNAPVGTLVLNGATLPFAVLCTQYPPPGGARPTPISVGEGNPHDTPPA